jgi:hypothetical protein
VTRGLRRVLKSAAHRLLGSMIDLLDHTDIRTDNIGELDAECTGLADALLESVRGELGAAIPAVEPCLAHDHRDLVRHEHNRWAAIDTWRLINAADPCGT